MTHDRETFPHALSMYLTRNNTAFIVERDGTQIGQPDIEAKIQDFLRDSCWNALIAAEIERLFREAKKEQRG